MADDGVTVVLVEQSVNESISRVVRDSAVLGRLANLMHHLPQAEVGAHDLIARYAEQLPIEVQVVVSQAVTQPQHLPVHQGVGQRDAEWVFEQLE